jgi:hypothetical protein
MNAFWASKNFEAFIALRSSQPGKQCGKLWPKKDPVLRAQINHSALLPALGVSAETLTKNDPALWAQSRPKLKREEQSTGGRG